MLKMSSLQDFHMPLKSPESKVHRTNLRGRYHMVVGQLGKKKKLNSVSKGFCCDDFNFELMLAKPEWSTANSFFLKTLIQGNLSEKLK